MSERVQMEWIGPELEMPPFGNMYHGDVFFIEAGKAEELKKKKFAKDFDTDKFKEDLRKKSSRQTKEKEA